MVSRNSTLWLTRAQPLPLTLEQKVGFNPQWLVRSLGSGCWRFGAKIAFPTQADALAPARLICQIGLTTVPGSQGSCDWSDFGHRRRFRASWPVDTQITSAFTSSLSSLSQLASHPFGSGYTQGSSWFLRAVPVAQCCPRGLQPALLVKLHHHFPERLGHVCFLGGAEWGVDGKSLRLGEVSSCLNTDFWNKCRGHGCSGREKARFVSLSSFYPQTLN